MTVPAQGGDPRALTQNTPGGSTSFQPTWTPNDKIAFIDAQTDVPARIAVMQPDRGPITHLSGELILAQTPHLATTERIGPRVADGPKRRRISGRRTGSR